MTDRDIVARLRSAALDGKQADATLHRDAADEIEMLRQKNLKLMHELDQFYRSATMEC